MTQNLQSMPDANGFFGPYGGQLVPPDLKKCMDEISAAYDEIVKLLRGRKMFDTNV